MGEGFPAARTLWHERHVRRRVLGATRWAWGRNGCRTLGVVLSPNQPRDRRGWSALYLPEAGKPASGWGGSRPSLPLAQTTHLKSSRGQVIARVKPGDDGPNTGC